MSTFCKAHWTLWFNKPCKSESCDRLVFSSVIIMLAKQSYNKTAGHDRLKMGIYLSIILLVKSLELMSICFVFGRSLMLRLLEPKSVYLVSKTVTIWVFTIHCILTTGKSNISILVPFLINVFQLFHWFLSFLSLAHHFSCFSRLAPFRSWCH